jgi:8-oxo-dGTP diphosphatase
MSEAVKTEWVDWLSTKVLQKAAVMDEAGNVLALRRSETRPMSRPGKWDLPGGSIGQGDLQQAAAGIKPHEAAIRREIAEETGLVVVAVTAIFVDSWTFERSPGTILGIAIGYRATVVGVRPPVRLSDEHVERTWGSPQEILALEFGDDGWLHSSIVRAADGEKS